MTAVGIPEVPYRPTMPVILRRVAATFGDDDYVVLPDRRISFRQAEAASRRLAKELLAAGVGKGTRTGIHLATGPEWAVAFLAVTRIGSLAMPFSTIYRPAELRRAMRVGDVAVLLTSGTMLGKDHESYLEEAVPGLADAEPGRFRDPGLPYLRSIWVLGETAPRWARRYDVTPDGPDDLVADGVDDELLEAVEQEVTPVDDMLAVFTSGTSADPKAVVHSQGAVVRKTSREADASLNTIFGGRVLSLMPFFWVGGVQEVVAALQSGAAILTLERLDARAALDLGQREQATSVMGNPQALRSLLGDTDLATALPSLRPLPKRPWEAGPGSKGEPPSAVGMTETMGPWSAVEGLECKVVDPETGETLDDGEVGEYLLRGYALMQSLYKREREEVFTPDGFYRTGDLGYAEGRQVFFHSRMSDMIKTKGANVAPAEVEAVLNAHPDVRISFVTGLPHDVFGQEVVAGVIAEEGRQIDVDALLAECRRELSRYKVPTMIEVLEPEEIRYLASSKPDRRSVTATLATRREARAG